MEVLCAQIHVLWQIALHAPHAHLAFLYHKHYRAQYCNVGCDLQLYEALGTWVVIDDGDDANMIYYKRHDCVLYYDEYHKYCPDLCVSDKEISLDYDAYSDILCIRQKRSPHLYNKLKDLFNEIKRTKKVPRNILDYQFHLLR